MLESPFSVGSEFRLLEGAGAGILVALGDLATVTNTQQ